MARQIVHIPAQRNIANRAVAQNAKIRVAAYCRVSTEQDEQLNSFENQVTSTEIPIMNWPVSMPMREFPAPVPSGVSSSTA